MRSHVQLPDSIPAYPKIFREAGYYCTNNSKEDYNSNFIRNPAIWNESSKTAHYKNRPPGQPFFAVFNITITHESQLDRERVSKYVDKRQIPPPTPRVNPDTLQPPYHPDLPEVREGWARLHDPITLMDSMVGERLAELEEEGAADHTIVFFYSDHGGQFARSKRYIYNVGTQVPLLVRFPEKWQHFAPAEPGSEVSPLVSFFDLPNTVLSMAGLRSPERMQGHVFPGPHAEAPPSTVFLLPVMDEFASVNVPRQHIWHRLAKVRGGELVSPGGRTPEGVTKRKVVNLGTKPNVSTNSSTQVCQIF